MSTLREALEALLADYDELTEDWKGLAGQDLRELLAAHPAEPVPAFVSPEQAKRLAWYASMDDASPEPDPVVTRSMEIPDAAVKDAFRAIQDHWHAPLPLTYADVTAALVAARPYLMPTWEEIWAAIYRGGKDSTSRELEFFEGSAANELTDAVVALLNGAES